MSENINLINLLKKKKKEKKEKIFFKECKREEQEKEKIQQDILKLIKRKFLKQKKHL